MKSWSAFKELTSYQRWFGVENRIYAMHSPKTFVAKARNTHRLFGDQLKKRRVQGIFWNWIILWFRKQSNLFGLKLNPRITGASFQLPIMRLFAFGWYAIVYVHLLEWMDQPWFKISVKKQSTIDGLGKENIDDWCQFWYAIHRRQYQISFRMPRIRDLSFRAKWWICLRIEWTLTEEPSKMKMWSVLFKNYSVKRDYL